MVEYKITQLPSAYEAMRSAVRAEEAAFNSVKTGMGGSNLGITESARREHTKGLSEINLEDDYAGTLFSISAKFTGEFTGLSRILRKIRQNSTDLSSLFRIINKDFFNTNNEEVFSQHTAGQKPGYELPQAHTRFGQYKLKTVGFLTPGLVFRGSLRASLTNKDDEFAVSIITNKSVRMGTRALNFEDKPLAPILAKIGRNPVIVGTRLKRWTQYAANHLTSMSPKDFK